MLYYCCNTAVLLLYYCCTVTVPLVHFRTSYQNGMNTQARTFDPFTRSSSWRPTNPILRFFDTGGRGGWESLSIVTRIKPERLTCACLRVLHPPAVWPNPSPRFIRQIRDKLCDQEEAFKGELGLASSAREGFRKVRFGRNRIGPPLPEEATCCRSLDDTIFFSRSQWDGVVGAVNYLRTSGNGDGCIAHQTPHYYAR